MGFRVIMSRAISRVTIAIIHTIGVISPRKSSHEPPRMQTRRLTSNRNQSNQTADKSRSLSSEDAVLVM